MIKVALNLVILGIQAIVSAIIVAPVLWLVGRALVGKDKAKFTDAIWIVVLGVVIGTLLNSVLSGLSGTIGWLVVLVMWLALIKHFFDCGWVKAFVVALVAVAVFIIIGIVLGILGFSALKTWLPIT